MLVLSVTNDGDSLAAHDKQGDMEDKTFDIEHVWYYSIGHERSKFFGCFAARERLAWISTKVAFKLT